MTNKLPLKAKIITGIATVVAAGAVTALVVILVTGGGNTNPSGGNDLTPDISSAAPGETSEPGGITTPSNDSPSNTSPSNDPPANTPPPNKPSLTTSSDLSDVIANLPRSDAVDILWQRLRGYWTATDNQFAGFTFNGGSPCVEFGYFQTEWHCVGKLTNAVPTGRYTATLTVHVPAQGATMISDARGEMWVDVYIDISDLPVDGKIKIKIEMQASGGWYQYGRGGNTLEEAYNAVH